MIVVTGATGNIGRPLTQALADAGQEVTAISRHAAAVPDGVRPVDPSGRGCQPHSAHGVYLADSPQRAHLRR